MSSQTNQLAQRRTKADFRFKDARLCFSFAATLGDRGKPQPYERLVRPADLARWCLESGGVGALPSCSGLDLVIPTMSPSSIEPRLSRRSFPS